MVGSVLVLGGSWLVAWLLERIGQGVRENEVDSLLSALLRDGNPLLFACVVLIGPIAEEVVFRLVMVSGLRKTLGPATAILLSSVAFAASHLDVARLPVFLAIGLVLGTAYERSGNLGVPIAIHVLNNLIAVRSLD